MKRVLLAFVALTAPGVSLTAQPTLTLAKPDAELSEPLSSPRGLRELTNGKVLLSDLRDKTVSLVDLAAGTMSKVGREGQGPGEYALPGGLYAMPNGTTWLHDLLGRRFLKIDANGKVGETVPMPGESGRGLAFVGGNAGGADGRGRLFFEAPPFNAENPNAGPPDSTAIMRWEPGKSTMDTVAWIKGPKGSVSATGGGGRVEVRIGGGKVFTPQERWGVAADGSVARVLPSPYRVIWYDPMGKPTPGPVVPYTPLKVTTADKDEVIAARKKEKPMMIAIGGNGGRVAPPTNVQIPPPEFEETKPPFVGDRGGASVLVTPEGEVWVARTRPAGDKIPTYDVFDRSGALIQKVVLNRDSRVLGFGKGTVYVLQTDEDDLQHLQRFRR